MIRIMNVILIVAMIVSGIGAIGDGAENRKTHLLFFAVSGVLAIALMVLSHFLK